jgi:hypothetical protein
VQVGEPVGQARDVGVGEHHLAVVDSGHGVELERRDHAEEAEVDDHAVEVRVAAADGRDVARGEHQLDRPNLRGEVAGPRARPVRRGRDRAGDVQVRQRGQVGQGQPVRRELLGQPCVGQAGADPHGGSVVQHVDGVEGRQCDGLGPVGDVVEGVAGAHRAQARGGRDQAAQRVEVGGTVLGGEVVRDGAGPAAPARGGGHTASSHGRRPL